MAELGFESKQSGSKIHAFNYYAMLKRWGLLNRRWESREKAYHPFQGQGSSLLHTPPQLKKKKKKRLDYVYMLKEKQWRSEFKGTEQTTMEQV